MLVSVQAVSTPAHRASECNSAGAGVVAGDARVSTPDHQSGEYNTAVPGGETERNMSFHARHAAGRMQSVSEVQRLTAKGFPRPIRDRANATTIPAAAGRLITMFSRPIGDRANATTIIGSICRNRSCFHARHAAGRMQP